MTGEELLDAVVADYLTADLPAAPTERVAALRDIVWQRWVALPLQARLTAAADLDDAAGLVRDEGDMAVEDLSSLEEAAVDALTVRARARIPELSVPEV